MAIILLYQLCRYSMYAMVVHIPFALTLHLTMQAQDSSTMAVLTRTVRISMHLKLGGVILMQDDQENHHAFLEVGREVCFTDIDAGRGSLNGKDRDAGVKVMEEIRTRHEVLESSVAGADFGNSGGDCGESDSMQSLVAACI